MKNNVKIPVAFQIRVDDVGWHKGDDDRWDNRPSRSGLPRMHHKLDYEMLAKLGKELNTKIGHACMNEAAITMAAAPESIHLDRLGIESGARRDIPELEKLLTSNVLLASGGWTYFYPDWFDGDDPYGLNERIAKAGARIMSERLAKTYKAFKEDKYLLQKAKEDYFDKAYFG